MWRSTRFLRCVAQLREVPSTAVPTTASPSSAGLAGGGVPSSWHAASRAFLSALASGAPVTTATIRAVAQAGNGSVRQGQHAQCARSRWSQRLVAALGSLVLEAPHSAAPASVDVLCVDEDQGRARSSSDKARSLWSQAWLADPQASLRLVRHAAARGDWEKAILLYHTSTAKQSDVKSIATCIAEAPWSAALHLADALLNPQSRTAGVSATVQGRSSSITAVGELQPWATEDVVGLLKSSVVGWQIALQVHLRHDVPTVATHAPQHRHVAERNATRVVELLAHHGRWQEAARVIAKSLPLNAASLELGCRVIATGSWFIALDFASRMTARLPIRDLDAKTFGTIARVCERAGRWADAAAIMTRAEQAAITLEAETYLHMVIVFGKARQPHLARAALRRVQQHGKPAQIVRCQNALLQLAKSHVTAEQWAETILAQDLEGRGVNAIEPESFDHLIERTCYHGSWERALKWFSHQVSGHTTPPSAASHDYLQYTMMGAGVPWELSLRVYDHVVNVCKTAPSDVACRSVVSLCESQGAPEEIPRGILESFVRRGV